MKCTVLINVLNAAKQLLTGTNTPEFPVGGSSIADDSRVKGNNLFHFLAHNLHESLSHQVNSVCCRSFCICAPTSPAARAASKAFFPNLSSFLGSALCCSSACTASMRPHPAQTTSQQASCCKPRGCKGVGKILAAMYSGVWPTYEQALSASAPASSKAAT